MFPELAEIKRRRKKLDMTQGELAKEAGVSRSMIAKVEGGFAKPSFDQAKKIFDALKRLEMAKLVGMEWVTVREIHNPSVEYARLDESLYEVVRRMEETNFSQFPVKSGSVVIGSVTERGINRALVSGPKDLSRLVVEAVMEPPFPQVPSETPAYLIIPLLQDRQAVLTVEKGEVVGIVTNSDIGKIIKIKYQAKL